MRSRTKVAIPKHRLEEKEREFWASAESSDYVDWTRGKRMTFPRLHPSTRTISLRLPEGLLADLKVLANKQDVPYQSLMKIYLAERIRQELGELRKAS